MSNAKAENQGSTPNGMDGRMLSRARRQAMSHGGKSGAGQVAAKSQPARTKPGAEARAAMSALSPVIPAYTAPVDNSPVASNSEKTDTCGCKNTPEQQTLEVICALVDAEPGALGSSASSVRQLCQNRRQALSSQGKLAIKPNGKNGSARRNSGGSRMMSSVMNGLSGRAAAQARREELCANGRGDSPVCRPSGRVRSATTATPAKVEEGNTLRGNLITGTQVERNNKITGIEAGSCRAITGTEYIGTEQYETLCAATPPAAPAKVGVGSTSRSQRVSGTQVGRSTQVTGDEYGACKNVTGNEYLNAEQFESLCASKPTPSPAKVGMFASRAGHPVSGTEVGRSTKVTGDEPGACLKLTGSQYYQPDQSGAVCQGSGVPHKVSVMSTIRGRQVTGVNVASSAAVTGSEYGACAGVTGTEYTGLQQYQGCNRAPVLTPEKVTVLGTWRGQAVSGTNVEYNAKVTGDEYGGCQPISGTEYIGPGQYTALCAPTALTATRERVSTPRGAAGASMTGVRQGVEKKVTMGSTRGGVGSGAGQRLSGTPYSDDARPALSGAVGMSQHPLTRGPADAQGGASVAGGRMPGATNQPSRGNVSGVVAPVQRNFSVMSPARTAQDSQLSRITGTAYGAQGRITGPVNLAAGLVSGTPEFRYRDDQDTGYAAALPVAQAPAQAPAVVSSNRVTGEGREGGFSITGAAWKRGTTTTGTEGTSATRRNPTQRGDQRSMAMQQITAMKEREHLQVPPSKVTGSSGNTATGSTITYSGGARG